jgi:hypothetical protein
MNNMKNPILIFKGPKQMRSKDTNENFDIRLGLRLTSDKKVLIETDKNLKKHCASLITETREAVDSSENS